MLSNCGPGRADCLAVEQTVDYIRQMKTVQILVEEELLKATDQAARRTRMNRSALVREALRSHLRELHRRELEKADREGCQRHPQQVELAVWETEARRPEE